MSDGRFGPIEPNGRPPRKRYRIDYNRLITVIMVVIIIVIAILIVRDYRERKKLAENNNIITIATPAPGKSVMGASPTAAPAADLRPSAEPGYVPIFRQANTNDLKIAITIDDCSDSGNIAELLSLAETHHIKYTFFPTGAEVAANEDLWRAVVLGGHEIENHTYSNDERFAESAEVMQVEIDMGVQAIRDAIGEGYAPHFLRIADPFIIDNAQMHALLAERGYFGIAMWTAETPRSLDEIAAGYVLLYHASDDGVKRLTAAAPILSENGFAMVTMNDLFDYPANIETDAESAG